MITNTGISKSALGPAIETLAYTKEETDELLDAKADKATTLAGYGITDAANTTGNQTISGIKTFKADNINIEAPSGNTARSIIFTNTNTNLYASIEVNQYGSIDLKNGTNAATRAPNQRGYNAANTTDVATIGTLDQYSPMVRTTGNQEIAGQKTFSSAIIGSAINPISSASSASASSGLYRRVFKIAKSQFTGVRNHYIFWMFTRSRGRAPDIITIYTTSNTVAGFNMVLRANAENYTYVLSTDTDYVYLYIMTSASAADGFQFVLQFSTEGNAPLTNNGTVGDVANIEGTEYARLTP